MNHALIEAGIQVEIRAPQGGQPDQAAIDVRFGSLLNARADRLMLIRVHHQERHR